ncbi:MAG TPA: glycosyl hydrolase 53 family protein [Puia sp.]|nr:glycosyl hydrolase 53 family protein [Puia sp.]
MDTTTTTPKDTPILKGADVSWLTQMEDSGRLFYDSAGTQMDCMQLLKGLGINLIRLRAWVHPATKYNSTGDVVAKAVRAHSLGLRVMIDFHYSDTWADPGHQTKPATWAGASLAALGDSVATYTASVLDSLKSAGVVPGYVQLGNETDNGMLWPDGEADSSMANYAALVNSAYNAVKAVSDTIKVIVHLSNGYDSTHFQWLFDGLKANGASWDVIGMSLYPSATDWQTYNQECLANMNALVTRYNKPVMVCEVGMPENQAGTCEEFITDLIHKVRAVNGGEGLGVLYWEPECYNNWQGYGLGAFDATGKPTVAMDAFLN